MIRIDALLREGRERLGQAAIEAPEREARLLLAASGGGDPLRQIAFSESAVAPAIAQCYRDLLARRVAREPLSHILGKREFFSRDFLVSADVLDPRPDSETLIEAVLARLPSRDRPWRLLDLGTGSGCLILTLLAELPQASGIGLDASAAALALAAANAERLQLQDRIAWRLADWRRPDWRAGLAESFDVAIANPPYIPTGEIARLAPEIRDHEPRLALDGGADGLDAYRHLAPALSHLLAPSGFAALEIGHDQEKTAAAPFLGAGLVCESAIRDLGGRPRCLIIKIK